jgi:IS5 family transposase
MIQRRGKILDIFHSNFIDNLDQNNMYIILAKEIDWSRLEAGLGIYYTPSYGAPALPVRLMVGLLIIKQLNNLSDEAVCVQWQMNHYYQAFTGHPFCCETLPCDPSMLSVFRKRIGKDGIDFIFRETVNLFGEQAIKCLEGELYTDTTAQEKYTAFPTDIKLAIDVIRAIWRICRNSNVRLKNKYVDLVNQLRQRAAFNKSNQRNQVKMEVLEELRDIGLKLLAEMTRKLDQNFTSTETYKEIYDNYYKALTQKKDDQNKIYSIFEPQIYCICKGKVHIKYEFGNKVAIVITRSGIIVSVITFDENIHDSKTVQPLLDDLSNKYGCEPEFVIGDAGYRGRKYYGNTTVVTPIKDVEKLSPEDKKLQVERMNNRSRIEQIFSHLKLDFGLSDNLLKGRIGDHINPLMAAIAYNLSLYARTIIKKRIKKQAKSKKANIKKSIKYKKAA